MSGRYPLRGWILCAPCLDLSGELLSRGCRRLHDALRWQTMRRRIDSKSDMHNSASELRLSVMRLLSVGQGLSKSFGLSLTGKFDMRVFPFIVGLFVVASANAQSLKERFLADYGPAVTACEERLSKNMEVVLIERQYDQAGRPAGGYKFTYQSNHNCVFVRTEKQDGQLFSLDLLRPDGVYQIKPSNSKPGEFILKAYTAGINTPSRARAPISGLVLPVVRSGKSLYDHIAGKSVTVLSDETKEASRELRVSEVFSDGTFQTTYRFRTQDLWLEEIRGANIPQAPFCVQYRYEDREGGLYPHVVESYVTGSDGTLRKVSDITFGAYHRKEFPDSEFSLTRFGLPDAVGVNYDSAISRHYLWLLFAGVICAVLALFGRRIVRRFKTSVESTT